MNTLVEGQKRADKLYKQKHTKIESYQDRLNRENNYMTKDMKDEKSRCPRCELIVKSRDILNHINSCQMKKKRKPFKGGGGGEGRDEDKKEGDKEGNKDKDEDQSKDRQDNQDNNRDNNQDNKQDNNWDNNQDNNQGSNQGDNNQGQVTERNNDNQENGGNEGNDDTDDDDDDNDKVEVREKVKSSYDNLIRTYVLTLDTIHNDFKIFWKLTSKKIKKILKNELKKRNVLKHSLSLCVLFQKNIYKPAIDKEGEPILKGEEGGTKIINYDRLVHFHTRASQVSLESDVDDILLSFYEIMDSYIESFTENGSGFICIDFPSLTYTIFEGSNLEKIRGYFEPPSWINKKCLFIPRNQKKNCLLWAIASGYYVVENPKFRKEIKKRSWMMDDDHLNLYFGPIYEQLENKLDKNDNDLITMDEKNLKKIIEKLNVPKNINIFTCCPNKKIIYSIYIDNKIDFKCDKNFKNFTMDEKAKHVNDYRNTQINVFIYKKQEMCHAAYIIDLDNFFLYKYYTKDSKTLPGQKYFCVNCGNFLKYDFLPSHTQICLFTNPDSQRIKFPSGKNGNPPYVSYLEGQNLTRIESLLTYDLECSFSSHKATKSQPGDPVDESMIKPRMAGVVAALTLGLSEKDQPHVEFLKKETYVGGPFIGKSCVIDMIKEIIMVGIKTKRNILKIAKEYEKLPPLNAEEKIRVKETKQCERCSFVFENENQKRRHHDHFGQTDRGSNLLQILCNRCNSLLKIQPNKFRCVGHNAFRFDVPLIISEIFKYMGKGNRLIRHMRCIIDSENVFKMWSWSYDCPACFEKSEDTGKIEVIRDKEAEEEMQAYEKEKKMGDGKKKSKKCQSLRHCVHAPEYIFLDSIKYYPHSLFKWTQEMAEPVIKGEKSFESVFPKWYQYLKSERYLEVIKPEVFLTKLKYPYKMWVEHDKSVAETEGQSGEQTDTEQPEQTDGSLDFLSVDQPPQSIADWPADQGEVILQEDVDTLKDLWAGLARWKKLTKTGTEAKVVFYDVLKIYLMADLFFLWHNCEHMSQVNFSEFKMEILSTPSMSGFSYKAFLSSIDFKIPLTNCINQFLMWKNSILGGICQIGDSKHISSNLPEDPHFNANKPLSMITAIDAVSQYGTVMSKYAIPNGGFLFLNNEEIQKFEKSIENHDFLKWTDSFATQRWDEDRQTNINIGYLITCDIYLSKDNDMHNILDPLPILFSKQKIPTDWESLGQTRDRLEMKGVGTREQVTKLVNESKRRWKEGGNNLKIEEVNAGWAPVTSGDKSQSKIVGFLGKINNVTLDYRLLHLLLILNYRITRISEILEFTQSNYMADYVNKRTEKRQLSKSKIEIMRNKALINMLFGRTLTTGADFLQGKIVTNKFEMQTEISKKSFYRYVEYEPECGLAIHKPKWYTAKSPHFIGATILSCSKKEFFSFIYLQLRNSYVSRGLFFKPCYVDTDGVIYHVTDATDERNRCTADGVKFDLPMYVPTDRQIEEKRLALIEGQRTNWLRGEGTEIGVAYDHRDPRLFQRRCFDALRSLIDFLDTSAGKNKSDLFFSYGCTEEQTNELWENRHKNKKKLGTWSMDVDTDVSITSVLLVRSKSYIIKTRRTDGQTCFKKRMKGIKSKTLQREVGYDDYVRICLSGELDLNKLKVRQSTFVRKRGKIFLRDADRLTSSPLCNKRFYFSKTASLCWGSEHIAMLKDIEILLDDLLSIICND